MPRIMPQPRYPRTLRTERRVGRFIRNTLICLALEAQPEIEQRFPEPQVRGSSPLRIALLFACPAVSDHS